MTVISTNFSRSLSFLRQEKGISQRIAAQNLGVSQALLSHYENGIREPGFSFVLRACEYYNVSADFLLGRTLSRVGAVILDPDPCADAEEPAPFPASEATETIRNKRLLHRSLDLLFRLLEKTNNPRILQAAFHYLGTCVYTLFRHLYQIEGKNSEDLFSVSSQQFSLDAAKIDLLHSEMHYVEALHRHAKEKGAFPDLSDHTLTEEHSPHYQSLLHIIYTTGERINRQLKTNLDA